MDYSVPFMSILGMTVTMLLCIGIPVALTIHLKKRTGASLWSLLTGCVVFVLFVFVFEQLFHTLMFKSFPQLSPDNIWLYAVYGGLAAGVFEETGRYLAMKTVLKKRLSKDNALMYGVGHGGIEAVLIAGIAAGSNLVYAIMVNAGSFASQIAAGDKTVIATVTDMCSYDSGLFFMSGVERVIAISLHICLSYIVYRAVKDKKPVYYVLAIAIHALVDAVAVVLSKLVSAYVIELVLAVAVVVMALLICKWYKNEKASEPAPVETTVGEQV